MAEHQDEILAEIRRIRDAHAAAFDYDMERIVQDIQRQERESGRTFITLPPKKPVDVRLKKDGPSNEE